MTPPGPHRGRGHEPLPAELVRHLQALGRWNDDGISRRAQARPCLRCAVVCMTGLTSEPCAWVVRADSVPIDAVGEVLALTSRPPRQTFRLRWYPGRGRYELDYRDPWGIRAAPAGSTDASGRRVVVLAEHRCGADRLPTSTAAGRALAEQARRAHELANPDHDGDPPY